MVVQHNLVSMFSNRQLGVTTGDKARFTEKLARGYRVNRAADDAAGLAISEKMRSQIRGLTRASDNSADGISLIQTADGALNQDHAMVQRMRELCVQASNDAVLTEDDQQKIQDELNEIIKEIDRVADNTEFNKKKLLDGTYGKGSGDMVRLAPNPTFSTLDGVEVTPESIDQMDGLKLIYAEIGDEFVATQVQTGMATRPGYDNLKKALKEQIVPQAVKAIIDKFPDTFGYLQGSTLGIGLKLYDDPNSSTMASVTTGYWYDSSGNIYKDNQTYKLAVNLHYLKLDENGYPDASSEDLTDGRSALETTIVHEMMHAFMDEALTNGMVGATEGVVDSANAFPKWFKEGMAQAACGGASYYNNWVNGIGLNKNSTEEQIRSAIGNTTSNRLFNTGSSSANYGTGYLASMYLAKLASGSNSVDAGTLRAGADKLLKEIKGGKSLEELVIEDSDYTSLSDFEDKFGVDNASVGFVKNLLGAIGDGGGSLVGGYASKDLLPDSAFTTNLFQVDTEADTVLNVYPSDVTRFTDGGKTKGGDPEGGGTNLGTAKGVDEPKPWAGDSFGEWLQVGANSGQGIYLRIADMHTAAMGLDGLSAMGHVNANMGIVKCDGALDYISTERSKLGAMQNRLEYTVKVDDNSAENLQAAESRIRDTDMAEEMTRLAKENILEQAGISMLSQANQQGQMVLSLLG